VVQLYVRDLESSVDRPLKELKDFKKVILKKGEKKTIEFTLSESAFAFWDEVSKDWKVEPGEFEILIGKSSENIILKKTIKI
jgi:beta-glucosidase